MSKQANPGKLAKVYGFLEKFWLVVSILSLMLTIYIVADDGFAFGKFYFLLPAMAFTIYIIRRRLRKSYEKMIQEEKAKK